ncbi:MAG TPA: hypothetical protein VK171_04275 [Fimbriimonas sp.]|nr:hypothetical protein [Fimbriimonas sp.]
MRRHFLLIGAVAFGCVAHAQEIKDWDKKAEKEKFHPTIVRGTPAAEREASYQKRLEMERDSFFGGVLWRNVGPEVQGGRVMRIVTPANNTNQLYVGFATGGLYRTEDDGQKWTSLWDNQSSFSIGDFDVTKDGKTIYLGTGEANNQRTSYAGTGVFKSTDSGATWQFVGLPESHRIGRVVIDPKNENTVYVAVMGHLYSQNPERGLYKTTDGGKTWNLVLSRDEFTGCTDLALNPKNSNIGLAAMYQRDRRAWNFLESGPGSGVLRTEDGGKSWKPVTTLPSGEACGRVGLAWAQSNDKIVYAFVENPAKNEDWASEDERTAGGRLTLRRFLNIDEDIFVNIDKEVLTAFWNANGPRDSKLDDVIAQVKEKKITLADVRKMIETRNPNAFDPGQNNDEVYKSEDGGKTFKRIRKVGALGGYYFNRAFVNPRNENDLWVTTLLPLRSKDGGKSFENGADNSVHVDYHWIHFDPRNEKTVWVGNDGGLYVSRNDGKSWTHINNLSLAQSTTIAVDNETPYNIYTGLQDNGTMKGPSTYRPGISDVNLWTDIAGGDGSAIFVDPRPDLKTVYVASQFGSHSRIDQAINRRANARPAGQGLRANWISPLILSPHHPDIVYVGFNRLFRSFDKGVSYKPISPDLTKNRPNGDVPHSTIKDVSESPLRFGLIYCGADDGRMTMTNDGGATWIDIPTPAPDKWISRVVASRYEENTVYVAQNGYRDDEFGAYLWKSTDNGKTWKSIVSNLPGESINVIREDHKDKNILYVGTDLGVFVTFDGGESWETLHSGLGHLPVHDLVIQEREDDLVIATHAKGCYILNLKAVRAVTKEMRTTDLTVLDLSDGIRLPSWGLDRRPAYSDTAPPSPTVKFNVFAKTPGDIKVELVDKDGKVLVVSVVKGTRGYNPVSLDLRLTPEKQVVTTLPKPKDAKEAIADPFGPNRATFVEIGKYKLVITQGSTSVTKEWNLR